MAAPTVEAQGAVASTTLTAGGVGTFNYPAAPNNAGKLFVALIRVNGATQAVVDPQGWTQVERAQGSAVVLIKEAVGGESGTFNITFNPVANPTLSRVLRVGGWGPNLASCIDDFSSSFHATAVTGSLNIPTLDTTGPDRLLLWYVSGNFNPVAWAFTPMGTPLFNEGLAANRSHAAMSEVQAAAGSTGIRVVSVDVATNKAAIGLAIKPAEGVALSRSIADSLAVADSPSRSLALGRSMAESGPVADVVARASSQWRPLAETHGLSDGLTRSHGHLRVQGDELLVADALERMLGANRSLAETHPSVDALTATVEVGGALVRTIGDDLPISDSLARVVALKRAEAETMPLLDANTASLSPPEGEGITRAISDTLAATDATTRALAAARPLSDALAVSDSPSRHAAFGRAITEAFPLDDRLAIVGMAYVAPEVVVALVGIPSLAVRLVPIPKVALSLVGIPRVDVAVVSDAPAIDVRLVPIPKVRVSLVPLPKAEVLEVE